MKLRDFDNISGAQLAADPALAIRYARASRTTKRAMLARRARRLQAAETRAKTPSREDAGKGQA